MDGHENTMADTLLPVPRKLWEHPDPKSTEIWRFMQEVNREKGLKMEVSGHLPDVLRLVHEGAVSGGDSGLFVLQPYFVTSFLFSPLHVHRRRIMMHMQTCTVHGKKIPSKPS